ncbi:MAG: HD-GYP domain-containing protein, partial [Candidatus Acidiferrales bacterium]
HRTEAGAMKGNFLDQVMKVNKELLLIFSIILFAAIINFFVSGQRLVLSFYDLPIIFAAYYFGRSRAVQTAFASILIVCWLHLVNPIALATGATVVAHQVMDWSGIAIWAGFSVVTAYAMGTLYELKEKNFNELRETYYGVLQILSGVVSNDKYTQNHSYRTSIYAARIAEHMGLPESRVEDIRAAALLHDIGKLEVSRQILYKAAKLSDEEIVEMHSHLMKGMDTLKPVGGSLRRILPIILSHHDKFDGTGYNPTQGEDIPLESRIISVADVYDSLTSDRPYRKAMSPFEARDVISKGAGKDFDPQIVAAFEASFRHGLMEVPEVLI